MLNYQRVKRSTKPEMGVSIIGGSLVDAGWLIIENPIYFYGWFGGTPILGNLQMDQGSDKGGGVVQMVLVDTEWNA